MLYKLPIKKLSLREDYLSEVVQLISEESGIQNHACLLYFYIKCIGVKLVNKII